MVPNTRRESQSWETYRTQVTVSYLTSCVHQLHQVLMVLVFDVLPECWRQKTAWWWRLQNRIHRDTKLRKSYCFLSWGHRTRQNVPQQTGLSRWTSLRSSNRVQLNMASQKEKLWRRENFMHWPTERKPIIATFRRFGIFTKAAIRTVKREGLTCYQHQRRKTQNLVSNRHTTLFFLHYKYPATLQQNFSQDELSWRATRETVAKGAFSPGYPPKLLNFRKPQINFG